MTDTNAITVLAVIYLLVVIGFQNFQELALFVCWLRFILFKRPFNLSFIMISFIGVAGLPLSLRQSRQGHIDEIDAISTTRIICFIILSKTLFSITVEQIHTRLKLLYKKNSVFLKLHAIKLLTFTMIMFFACIFFYGIDIVLVWINSEPMNTKQNVVTSSGKLHGMVQFVNISDGDLASTQRSFLVDEHQSSIYSLDYVFHDDMKHVPKIKDLKETFPGQKAEFTCSLSVRSRDENVLYSSSLFFAQDSVEVRNSPRRRLHFPKEKIKNGLSYTFSLTLYDIQLEDFGIYRAGLRTIRHYGPSFSESSVTMYHYVHVMEEYVCVFNLSRITDYYQYVDVPVGALLSFKHLYIQSESDYVRVEHYVNGIPLNMISNISSECCLPSVRFYMEVWNQKPLDLPLIYIYNAFPEYSEVRAMVCACSSIYGIHRFKFYNDIYDEQRKMWITTEYWHPHITVVYPKSSILPWNSISKSEYSLIERSKTNTLFSLFEGSAFELLKSNMDDDFIVMKYIEWCVILGISGILLFVFLGSFVYFFTLLAAWQTYAYDKLGLMLRVNLPDTGGNLANVLQNRNASVNDHRDVFVLYVDDNRNFVIYELYPVIIDKTLSVFLSEDDGPSGPTLNHLIEALTNSKKVIVVVSDSFINNKFYNDFFLPDIVLRSLAEGLIVSRNLMLLLCESCMVPEALIKDDRIVILDFTRNPRNVVLGKLNEWLENPVIRRGFREQPMLHPELLQLSQV